MNLPVTPASPTAPDAAEIAAKLAATPTRLARTRHGHFLYFTTDMYVGRSLEIYGEFSESEAAIFRQLARPGTLVLEIGANIGTHTVLLAELVGRKGRVIAIEPQRGVFQLLCANLALNGIGNTLAIHAGAGRNPGSIEVPNIDYSKEGNFGGLALGSAKGEKVRLLTVDELALKVCHLIKIDVEGMESEVIAGAAQTIARTRPALYVENDRKEKSAALIAQIQALGYRLYWHLPPLFNPQNFAGNRDNIFGNIVSVNMLCLPAESKGEIKGFRPVSGPEDDWRKPA
jgi:FkbM family methyltransferase